MKHMKEKIVYVLKKVDKDMATHNYRFKYPKRGWVEAEDWNGEGGCGGGLHGLEWGAGRIDISNYGELFVVIKVNKNDGYISLGEKVKFRRGYVVLTTKSSKKAIDYIKKFAPPGLIFNYDNSSDYFANQGYCSVANQGSCSVANQEFYSVANQEACSIANQGNYSIANQGDYSIANQEHHSIANQGKYSVVNQGYCSVANQDDCSTVAIRGGDLIYRNRGTSSVITMLSGGKTVAFQQSKDYFTNETVLIQEMKIIDRYSGTPENITSLKCYEVFVFGSNLLGNHAGGAANIAREKFGAKYGIGEGFLGQSYAFPVLGKHGRKLKKWRLRKAVKRLIKCACNNTIKVFLVTKVGCEIAGYDEKEIKSLFDLSELPANIVLPKEWY